MTAPDPARQAPRFLALYALAAAGGAIAYVPFLTILLPLHATRIAGDEALALLAGCAFVGAVAASLANIAFGWASDRTGGRRGWIVAGLIGSSLLLLAIEQVTQPAALIAIIALWQLSLNMMLGPLAAWAGDAVPHGQKGLLGGLLALAPALGALTGMLVTQDALVPTGQRMAVVAAIVAACVAPVLIAGRPHPMPQLMRPVATPDRLPARRRIEGVVARMWLARLLVQIAEAALFAFLLLWLRSVAPGLGENDAATLFAGVLCAAVLFTLAAGRWSDRHDSPIRPLAICAGMAAAGLAVMAGAAGLPMAIAGYALFGLASSVFLALHSSQTLRVLPRPQTRGRDLGVFNLTNTVPSLVMPWLTLALVPSYGFGALFALLAALAAGACILLLRLR